MGQVGGGIVSMGFGIGQLCFGVGDFGFIGVWVDGEEYVVFFDQCVIFEVDGGQGVVDQWVYFDVIDCFDVV